MEICYNVQGVIYLPFIKNKNENTIDYSPVIRITIAIPDRGVVYVLCNDVLVDRDWGKVYVLFYL